MINIYLLKYITLHECISHVQINIEIVMIIKLPLLLSDFMDLFSKTLPSELKLLMGAYPI